MSSSRPVFRVKMRCETTGPLRRIFVQCPPSHPNGEYHYVRYSIEAPLGDYRETSEDPLWIYPPGPQWLGVDLCLGEFDSTNLASGLPDVKSVFDDLSFQPWDIKATPAHRLFFHVRFEPGMCPFYAHKLISLALVLEDALLMPLVLPSPDQSPTFIPTSVPLRKVLSKAPILRGSLRAMDSYVPSIEAIKPSLWNDRDPELGWRLIQRVWQAESLHSLSNLLRFRCYEGFDFWPYWIQLRHNPPPNKPMTTHPDCGTWVIFPHFQPTFDHSLFRNWAEIIARIAELAQASPAEYKKCLETVFGILDESNQASPPWERLMEYLKLEHRIPDWRDQLARYKRGEGITGLSENGLLPKRKRPRRAL